MGLSEDMGMRTSLHAVLALAAVWAGAGPAGANPTRPTVVNGQVSIQPAGNLVVANTPGSVVNWQGFSIGANQVTRFVQQSSSSAVLNRVVAQNASTILGMHPTGAQVVNGTVTMQQAGNLLTITNSPNSIINWQSFSIGANEITRFVQQSSSSAVLNRVVGQNPSSILGMLQSNGRVFLINPSGIMFGAGAQVDVAGLVASTLNLSDQDFLAGRLRFTDTPGAGAVVNQGAINGAGAGIYLVGASVTNGGVITNPGGEVVLAAGSSVELVDPGTPSLRVEITAPDNEARNLGQIMADAGRVGIYAGIINHSGRIRADSAQVTEDGRIVLKATQNVTLEPGSVTTANGPKGGTIEIQAGDTALVSGVVEATGSSGKGGTVKVLGNLVGLTGSASIDVSGTAGGGTVLVGGDSQGSNPEVQNAFRTYFGPDAVIRADARINGDGGKVILWSEDATRAYGTITARGGSEHNGGHVEVSGRRSLEFNGRIESGVIVFEVMNPGHAITCASCPSGNHELFSGVTNSTISFAASTATLANANATITTSGGVTLGSTGNISIHNAANSAGNVTVVATIHSETGSVTVQNASIPVAILTSTPSILRLLATAIPDLLQGRAGALFAPAQVIQGVSTILQIDDPAGLRGDVPGALRGPRGSLVVQ